MSTILQGRPYIHHAHSNLFPITHRSDYIPLMTTWPFLRSAEHCMGKVREAPALALKSAR